nr:MAG TPA: ribosomal protein S4/S9-like protein [Caudoviricetes sp.]
MTCCALSPPTPQSNLFHMEQSQKRRYYYGIRSKQL